MAWAIAPTSRPAVPVLEKIAENIEKSRQKIEKEELKRRQVLSALYEINKKMRQTVSEKSKMRAERNSLEDNIGRLSERVNELDETSKKLQTRLAERLRTIHRLGGPSTARMLLSASSSSQLDRDLKIMGLIATRDRDLIREYQAVRREVGQKRERLAQRKSRLQNIERGLKSRETRLASEQNLKSRLLDGIRRKKIFALRNIQELKDQTKEYAVADDAVLDLLLRPSFAEEKGRLNSPVSGVLKRDFGMEKSHEQSWMIAHKGVRWAVPAGQPVRAVFSGSVAWVGQVPGLGQAVILDHGDHYYSVYGETQNVRVRPGDEVRREQVIASVGAARGGQGAGLHFEIRHFSEPEDPKTWMKGTAL
ncbi:MAG: peptidoglycan DD-metalloendopeptidase family protein [Bdellovibrionaceae bacterium]|nr:peptidoglycan DD-metalloendopeptidase family protein [Pseudobdellovibrionaceae bacterium]